MSIDAPCKECNRKPCGVYHDRCYAYQQFKKESEKRKAEKLADSVLRESRERFWLDMKNKGFKKRRNR